MPMFPIVRLIKDLLKARRMAPLNLTETHVSSHICWPWDLDFWLELNNGRAMTLYDLGRTMLATIALRACDAASGASMPAS